MPLPARHPLYLSLWLSSAALCRFLPVSRLPFLILRHSEVTRRIRSHRGCGPSSCPYPYRLAKSSRAQCQLVERTYVAAYYKPRKLEMPCWAGCVPLLRFPDFRRASCEYVFMGLWTIYFAHSGVTGRGTYGSSANYFCQKFICSLRGSAAPPRSSPLYKTFSLLSGDGAVC